MNLGKTIVLYCICQTKHELMDQISISEAVCLHPGQVLPKPKLLFILSSTLQTFGYWVAYNLKSMIATYRICSYSLTQQNCCNYSVGQSPIPQKFAKPFTQT